MIYFDLLQYMLYGIFKKERGFKKGQITLLINMLFLVLNMASLTIWFGDFLNEKCYIAIYFIYFVFLQYYYFNEEALRAKMGELHRRKDELENKLRVVVLGVFLSLVFGCIALIKFFLAESTTP